MKEVRSHKTLPLPFERKPTPQMNDVEAVLVPLQVAHAEELDPIYTVEFAHHSTQFDRRIRAARRA